MIRAVEIGILFSTSITDRSCGQRFLDSLPPKLYPHKFNDHEPINRLLNENSLSEALELWGRGFLWRAKAPKTSGHFLSGRVRRQHDVVIISTTMKTFISVDLVRFMLSLDERFGIDFAYVNIETSHDQEVSDDYYFEHVEPFSQGIFTRDLQKGLPNLPWACVFGEPYRVIFGAKLESAPVHSSSQLANSTLLQLTENPEDVSHKRGDYEATRDAVQEHLGCNAFRATGTKPLKVPKFDFEVN